MNYKKTIVGFNLVLEIDGKHKLIADESVFNCKDLTLLPTIRKGILNVLGEYSLACLIYNMKLTINIMGHENTMALLHKVA